MAKVARVTINGGTPKYTMTRPFRRPANAPPKMANQIAAQRGNPKLCHENPKRIVLRAIIEPTERSIPPRIIMKVIGTANRATSHKKRVWLSKLLGVKNRSDVNDKTK